MVRTLLDRKDNIVTKDADKEKEENIIREALSDCGYPGWAVDRVKKKRQTPKVRDKPTKKEGEKSQGLVVIPYIEGLSERLSRVFKKHNFSTAMKPYITLRRMLVHPKTSGIQFMKSRVTAVPRLTSGKPAEFSKQDSQNTKKKRRKLVPKISPGLKEKHLHQRLINRNF